MHDKEIVLEGTRVRLVPLQPDHDRALFAALDSPRIWEYLPCRMECEQDMHLHVLEAIQERENGHSIPFVVYDQILDKIVGMTRLQEIAWEDRKLEIGYTWYATEVWRTRVNTESKYLLLQYCFEVLQLIRVQFRADRLNQRSNEALLRIGAVKEGEFRKDRILYNGRIRDTVFYSITDEDWPYVKQKLAGFLATS